MTKLNNGFSIDFEKLSRNRTILLVGRNWALIFLISMLILFSFLGKYFFSLRNFTNIILGVSSLLLLASGETFVIISGGIDLSIGFIMGFVCISSSIIMRDLNAAGYSPIISMMTGSLVGLLLGLIPGFINGFFVAKLRVPPFIATLGMWGIANGLAWRLCEGFPVGFLPLQVRNIGNAYLAYFSPKKGFSFLIKPELTEREDILSLVKILTKFLLTRRLFYWIFNGPEMYANCEMPSNG